MKEFIAFCGIWKSIIYILIYGSTVLCWTLAAFSAFYSYTQSVGLLGRGISPSQGRYLHTEQHKHRINVHTDVHICSRIRTHDPSVRASEDSSCLRPRGHCYRLSDGSLPYAKNKWLLSFANEFSPPSHTLFLLRSILTLRNSPCSSKWPLPFRQCLQLNWHLSSLLCMLYSPLVSLLDFVALIIFGETLWNSLLGNCVQSSVTSSNFH
jgi:hypothetical protein